MCYCCEAIGIFFVDCLDFVSICYQRMKISFYPFESFQHFSKIYCKMLSPFIGFNLSKAFNAHRPKSTVSTTTAFYVIHILIKMILWFFLADCVNVILHLWFCCNSQQINHQTNPNVLNQFAIYEKKKISFLF